MRVGIRSRDYVYFVGVRAQVQKYATQISEAWARKQATLVWSVYLAAFDQSLIPADEAAQRFGKSIKALQPIYEPVADGRLTALYQDLDAYTALAFVQSTMPTPELATPSMVNPANSNGAEFEPFKESRDIITRWLNTVYPWIRDPLSDKEKQRFTDIPDQVQSTMIALSNVNVNANRKRKRDPSM